MAKVSIRELALETLLKVLEEGEYSSVVIPQVLSNYQYLDKQERAFFTRLCEGTIERAIELDYILDQFSKVKTKKMKPVIRTVLRMGVYQLKYMRQVPASAACNEAVKLAQRKGFHNLKGFVNGVLRNIHRNLEQIVYPDKEKEPMVYLSVTYSVPQWLPKLWTKQYGYALTEQMLAASFCERPTVIRCNENKLTVKQLTACLQEEQVQVKPGAYVDAALQISGYDYLAGLDSFQKGYFQVQDESSMLVAMAAGIREQDQIVDVCAAPGGKSLHAATILKGTGMVSARDLTEGKVAKIRENQERLGIENMQAKVQDALVKDESMVGMADVVIADLPCSGLGVLGKKNDIKYKASLEGIEQLQSLQRNILRTVCEYVKPGGTLIYSTCTVNKKENEENCQWIQQELGLKPDSLDPYLPTELLCDSTAQGYLQLFPGKHQTDGFFLARFQKA